MRKNKEVAVIGIIHKDFGGYIHCEEILDKYALPYGTKNAANIDNALTYWNDSRCIPLGRPNYDKVLAAFSAKNSNDLIPFAHMASLTDNYWFKKDNSNISWEDISFRHNGKCSDLYKTMIFDVKESVNGKLGTPDLTTDGAIPKFWARRDDNFVLLKSSMGNMPMDVLNEVIASEILTQLNILHVSYSVTDVNGIYFSECPCFITSDKYEFVPTNNLLMDNFYATTNDYLDTMCKFGFMRQVEEMKLCDMLIGNTDRHAKNYGQIVDSDTHRVLCLAPLFDQGSCNFYLQTLNKRQIYRPTNMTFLETAERLNDRVREYLNRLDFNRINDCLSKIPLTIVRRESQRL